MPILVSMEPPENPKTETTEFPLPDFEKPNWVEVWFDKIEITEPFESSRQLRRPDGIPYSVAEQKQDTFNQAKFFAESLVDRREKIQHKVGGLQARVVTDQQIFQMTRDMLQGHAQPKPQESIQGTASEAK